MLYRYLSILFVSLTLAACGGSSGGDEEGSSDWDGMVWDQDDWA